MSLCVCKKLFNSLQVCGGYCKMFMGFTFLPDTLLFNAVYFRSDMHLTAQHPIHNVYI